MGDANTIRQEHAARLIAELRSMGIHDERVLEAMQNVPRDRFLPGASMQQAWADNAQPIGYGQTISQPFVVALMAQCLELTPQMTVLEIGAGSGYLAAILSTLCRQVITIERLDPLARRAHRTLSELGYSNVTVLCGDGTFGWPANAPYDRIVISAGGASVPETAVNQLSANGGILLMPVGERHEQSLELFQKHNGSITCHTVAPVRFVPLLTDDSRPSPVGFDT